MAFGDFKDLLRWTTFDKVLRDKGFNIAKNPKYDGYQRELASMVCKFLDKNFLQINLLRASNQELAKQIIKKFERRKVYSSFKYNIWGADLVDMQFIS